jgi:outer membrane receptor protein involved in Fe transport
MLGKIPAVTVLRANTRGEDINSERALNCGPLPTYPGCAENGGPDQIVLPEYTLVDLNVNLMVTDNATVSFFVENLTDEEHIFASFGEITTTLGTISFLSGPPRTTGISFTVNY